MKHLLKFSSPYCIKKDREQLESLMLKATMKYFLGTHSTYAYYVFNKTIKTMMELIKVMIDDKSPIIT